MNEENGEVISEEASFIGDFELPLDAVVTSVLPENKDLVIEIKKSERKEYDVKGEDGQATGEKRPYFNLQLIFPDHPGENVFHKFFPSAKSLASRDNTRSYKLFLDTLKLPYTTHPANNGLANIRFKGQIRDDKKRSEYILSKVVGPA